MKTPISEIHLKSGLFEPPAIDTKFKGFDISWIPIEYALGFMFINRPEHRWNLPTLAQISKRANHLAYTNPAPRRSPSGSCNFNEMQNWFSENRRQILSELN